MITYVEPMAGWSGTKNQLFQRVYQRTFLVKCDSPLDGPATIFNSGVFPAIGNSYYVTATERDNGSFLQSIVPELVSASDNPPHSQWKVVLNFGPYEPLDENPTEWPLVIGWGADVHDKVVTKDVDGNPIVNSAGDPFKDPVTIPEIRRTLNVKRNEKTFDPDLAAQFEGKLNLYEFCGAAPKTVLCGPITAELRHNDNVGGDGYFNEVTYQFMVDHEGWDKKLLDRGFNVLDGGTLKPITNDGQPPSEPELLDGSGGKLASGGSPFYLNFDVIEAVDFAGLDMDFTGALGQNADEGDTSGGDGDGEGGGGGDV